jgi:hypothetical protein
MMKCARGLSIALFALLTAASACLAAGESTKTQSDSLAAPPDSVPVTPILTPDSAAVAPALTTTPATTAATPAGTKKGKKPKNAGDGKPAESAKFGNPGQASLGGGLGLSYFLGDADYTKERNGPPGDRDVWDTRSAKMRGAFAANLRYTASNRWRWQISPGFLWTGYKDNARAPFRTDYFPNDSLMGNWLTLVMPAHAQIQMLHHIGPWLIHEGVGGGAYRVWIEQDRHVVKDPVTKKLHRGFYPGVTGEIGAERFLKAMNSVSLEWTAASHLIFATRDEQFPSGFNSNVWTAEVRFGANYHFNPTAAKKAGSSATK